MRVRLTPWSPVRTLLLLIGVGLGSGCPRDAAEAPPERLDAGSTPAGARVGVQVPMPAGWTARIGSDQSFQAGPPGTALMRIDRHPGAASALPSPDQLRNGLEETLGEDAFKTLSKEQTDGLSLISFEVAAGPITDGGEVAAPQPGVLAAKAVGKDLYLCASLPGAGVADVRSIIQACRELTVRAAK